LKIAKGMFYPEVEIEGKYLSANGGRAIDIPLGDMLNGVYSSLNQLTQTDKFPQLENRKINFLPENFYDAKLHASIPIFNPEMIYNKKIKQGKFHLSHY